ncbi:protein of unknown function [Georgfuchsia toluolica]|uniref:Uncharacterized protein n=1 Tax=Georgfuchsia toluolica TaxID=424218 RepID=A0A916NIJ9_9PROT|nr:protein of unknown function [Georgfuchsia toluolica]
MAGYRPDRESYPATTPQSAALQRAGRITIGEAVKFTGTSRNALKLHFCALVENHHLPQQGSGAVSGTT